MRRIFFTEYLKNMRTVGAVAPSSIYLARKMLEQVNFSAAAVIVEYGPGTGVFTDEIIKQLKSQTKLFVIEQNSKFAKLLVEKYAHLKNVHVVNDTAERATTILNKQMIKRADYVISGLPFAALPINVSRSILESTVTLLGKRGVFITFQYTLFKKKFIHEYFKRIDVTKEYRNIPSAYVFCCDNK